MEEIRGNSGVVRFSGVVKIWPGSVGAMRPDHCPKGGCPAFAKDGSINLHGHGIVIRHQRGPPHPDAPADDVKWVIRRYRCKCCESVCRVLPSSATARKHFSAAAIAMALALWGLMRRNAEQVRRVVNERATDGEPGWASIGRWAKEISAGTLLPELGLRGAAGRALEVAAKAASALCGWAPVSARETPLDHQAFAGACHVR